MTKESHPSADDRYKRVRIYCARHEFRRHIIICFGRAAYRFAQTNIFANF
jgi:hypothetical protein